MVVMVSVAAATEYPVSEKLVREHFYHDALHGKLEAALAAENKRFKQLDARVMRFAGAKPVIPFSHTRRRVHYTPEQVKTSIEQGWVETWRFSWSISKQKILETMPPWLDTFAADVTKLEADLAVDTVPAAKMEKMNKTRQRISDFIGTHQVTLKRLKQWDGWCRKGPWLLEDSSPVELAGEIDLLELYLLKRKAGESADFPFQHFTSVDRDRSDSELTAFALLNLKEKKRIWHWYHAFKMKSKGKQLTLGVDGYRLLLKYQLYGPGANQQAMEKISRAMALYWQGRVAGTPFTTVVDISLLHENEAEKPDAMQVRIGGEDEILWPSYRELPWHFDAATVAHEFGHGLGFADRYRDVYSFSEGLYRSYQWDIFSLMSAQNGPDPVVTEKDLKLLIEHYLKN